MTSQPHDSLFTELWNAGHLVHDIVIELAKAGHVFTQLQLQWQRRRLGLAPRLPHRFTSEDNPAWLRRRTAQPGEHQKPGNALSPAERKIFQDGLSETGSYV